VNIQCDCGDLMLLLRSASLLWLLLGFPVRSRLWARFAGCRALAEPALEHRDPSGAPSGRPMVGARSIRSVISGSVGTERKGMMRQARHNHARHPGHVRASTPTNASVVPVSYKSVTIIPPSRLQLNPLFRWGSTVIPLDQAILGLRRRRSLCVAEIMTFCGCGLGVTKQSHTSGCASLNLNS
jgi:hypothetical protein